MSSFAFQPKELDATVFLAVTGGSGVTGFGTGATGVGVDTGGVVGVDSAGSSVEGESSTIDGRLDSEPTLAALNSPQF